MEFLVSDSSKKKVYLPAVREGIEWSTQRRGAPGKLTFQVVQDELVCLPEGAAVRLKVGHQFSLVSCLQSARIKMG